FSQLRFDFFRLERYPAVASKDETFYRFSCGCRYHMGRQDANNHPEVPVRPIMESKGDDRKQSRASQSPVLTDITAHVAKESSLYVRFISKSRQLHLG